MRPRKTPRQERARRTRDRILDAAARVFGDHGYAAGTTNRIAQAAGLSIGTLYQHFPNKDAILAELMRRHVADGVAAVGRHLDTAGAASDDLATRLRPFVDAALENHAGDGRLHQVLFEESPRPRALVEELHELEARLVDIVAGMLDADARVVVPDVRLAAWLVIAAIESLTHRFSAARAREGPAHDDVAFAEELVAMLAGYLSRRPDVL